MSPEGRDCDALCRASLYLTDVLMLHQIGKGQVAGSAIGVSFAICDYNLQLSDRENNLRLSDFLLVPGYDLSSQSH